jgi:hypothetical protein
MATTEKCILVTIASQQKGFLISLAKLLAEENKVYIEARDNDVKNLVAELAPELMTSIAVRQMFSVDVDDQNIIEECHKREEKYGESFVMISSADRGLGKGYLFNADRYPDIDRAWWEYEEKLRSILEDFLYYEYMIEKYSPKAVITLVQNKVFSLICRHHNITYLGIQGVRFSNRYYWTDNEHGKSSKYIKSIKENLEKWPEVNESVDVQYEQEAGSKYNHMMFARYSYAIATKSSLKKIALEIYSLIRNQGRTKSYKFLGWLGPILRRPRAYKYFEKYGKRPEELKDFKLVYVPLNLEPEYSLLSLSPEFNNSMEMIAWISKSVPANVLVVVKEQPFSFGVRSKRYYENFRMIPNVVLAHPKVSSWEWIKASNVIATITGTAGVESVYFKKPVLSYGKHQIINYLPTVRFANNFETTKEYVNELLEFDKNNESFEVSKWALYRAQMNISFELLGFEKLYSSDHLQTSIAQKAIENLYREYPTIFANGN